MTFSRDLKEVREGAQLTCGGGVLKVEGLGTRWCKGLGQEFACHVQEQQ